MLVDLPCLSGSLQVDGEFQETQSMLGNWSTHLMGAYSLLEACGGVKALPISSRLETQIGILTWYVNPTSHRLCTFS